VIWDKERMYVLRVPVCGGFVYLVYSNEVSHAVDPPGVCYLYSLGWHPETNALVSADDDAILRRHAFVRALDPALSVEMAAVGSGHDGHLRHLPETNDEVLS